MNKAWSMTAAALGLAFTVTAASQAHRLWLLPSNTVLSGEESWITVDAAVSNDLFYFNHVPLGLESIVVTAPDGSNVAIENGATGKYRSVFDLHLDQQGTYRIASVRNGFFASYMLDGERHRWRGQEAEFAAHLPEGASEVETSRYVGRVETFATLGAPSSEALAPTGSGIELVAVTHPTDLYAGERAEFQILLNGEPYAGASVELVEGGTRYRDAMAETTLTTDDEGHFSYTWPEAGMYWFEVGHRVEGQNGEPGQNYGYAVTLEVLPL
ncbi:DUF4198 domain-containing protein [Woodsholea maritima]|uniref:DUF4198 domain-containing protein n=1 Tax=Woodsholea maritima TaxID=240237 RepID=UPI0003773FE0|nr:DUF4198 domain-containing protein [Woodsholea maritima]